jgi:Uma2 family endonuclease
MSTVLPDVPATNFPDAAPTVFPDAPPTEWTMADVQARLAGFPADRIRTYPAPGTATEQDVLDAEARSNRICELIDGTLVEKTMATYESMLAFVLAYFLQRYLDTNNLGGIGGEAGLLKILPGQIRAPDVSFTRWERLPGRQSPKPPIYAVAPDLAVEILSKGNTEAEMNRKLHEYFEAGVRLVWYIEPKTRTARAYTAEHEWTEIGSDGLLLGGEVLPGFEVPLAELFARADGPVEK